MRHNAIYFTGSMAVAFLNYIYHPILSRLLPARQFGEVQTIFSLSLAVGIVLNVLGMVALNIVSNRDENPEREHVLADLQSLSFYLIAAASVLLIVFRDSFSSSLRFESPLPFIVLAAILLTNAAFTFRRFYLQAHRKFAEVSVANAIVAGGRVAIAAVLVLLGLGTFGAIGALVVAQCVALAYVLPKTSRAESLKFTMRPFTKRLMPEVAYALITLFSLGFITFITSADVVYAKYFFDPETAGVYSGISTVGRIIFFSTSSVAGVLLPSIKRQAAFADNSLILKKSFMLLMVIGGIALVAMYAFPSLVVNVLIGAKFLPLHGLLPRVALLSFVASVINLFAFYYLALRSYWLIGITTLGAVVTAATIAQQHNSPDDIVDGFLYGSLAALALLIGLFMFHWYKHNERSYERR